MITRLLNSKVLSSTFQIMEHNVKLTHPRLKSAFSTLIINQVDRQKLVEQSTKLENPYPNLAQLFTEKPRIILPDYIQNAIETMKVEKKSLLLLKGFPTGFVPPSGNMEERLATKSYTSEHILLSVARQVGGRLFTSEKSKHPALIHQVAPQKGHYHEANGLGLKDFHYHIEEAYEKDPIHYLVLSCLQGDHNAKTSFIFLSDILSDLPKAELQEVPFQFESGTDFSKKEILTSPILTINPEDNSYHVRLYENDPKGNRGIQMKATNERGEQLLKTIQQRISQLKTAGRTLDIQLEPGDVTVINNGFGSGEISGVMHTRKGTIENPNRWLQRVYLKAEIIKPYQMFKTELSKEGICTLTLDTEKSTNPFNNLLMDELTDFLKSVNKNPNIKSVILYGGDGKSFSAGGDFKEVSQLPYLPSSKTVEWLDRVINMYTTCLEIEKPVVMAIDNHCIGIGFQIAMCADMIIATPKTKFMMPELKGGIACTVGSYMLEKVFTRATMLDMTLRCEAIDIQKARAMDFVYDIVDQKSLISTAQKEALRCQSFPETSFKKTKSSRNSDFIEGLANICEKSKVAHVASFEQKTAESYMHRILKKKPSDGTM